MIRQLFSEGYCRAIGKQTPHRFLSLNPKMTCVKGEKEKKSMPPDLRLGVWQARLWLNDSF
jgi:hypothetical protein